MGLFNLFHKKTEYFDPKIPPKCEYCANGRPAKSNGKILCSKCGIVAGDYSCKKFSYSPLMRIPENTRPKTSESENMDSPAEAENTDINNEQKASAKALLNEESQLKEELKQAAQSLIDFEPVPEIDLDGINMNDTQAKEEPAAEENTASEVKPVLSKTAPPEVKPAEAESFTAETGEINMPVKDNSESIAKLREITDVPVQNIKIEHEPKEIILPDSSGIEVESISLSHDDNRENIEKILSAEKPNVEPIANITVNSPVTLESIKKPELKNLS